MISLEGIREFLFIGTRGACTRRIINLVHIDGVDFLRFGSNGRKVARQTNLTQNFLALESRPQTADSHDGNQHKGPLRSY